MARLSSPLSQMKPHYEVIVIGSGYGGGIAASRMARAGRQVCLLERGKEFRPGEYPDQELEALTEMQMDLPNRRIGHQTGLFDFHINPDINVLVGCGLGGTSLINANVSLEPRNWILEDNAWPEAIRNDRPLLNRCFDLARDMLKPVPLPAAMDPCKLQAMKKAAEVIGAQSFYRPPINVNFQEGANHVGVHQDACNGCGDCVSGCNTGAKNTTLMNYLPDAHNHGAEIFTETAVRWIEKVGDRWNVHFQYLGGPSLFNAPDMSISAEIVVLAAGTLGSTEILLRSKEKGLQLSAQLGQHFTGNGDFLGFGYNTDSRCNGIGTGLRKFDNPADVVGACITGIIDMRGDANGKDPEGMVIEEGVIPGALSAVMPLGLAAAAAAVGDDTDQGFLDTVKETFRKLRNLDPFRSAYHGADNNTMTYLVMTHDNAKGNMHLEGDRLRISWPGAGEQPIFEKVNHNLREVTKALGGVYIKNPAWSEEMGHNLTTVHPLGGCVIGEDATKGAVNHKGQAFTGAANGEVHPNLYVCDGSIVPRTLGVNPLLTISALSERNCHYMATDRNWTIDYSFGPVAEKVSAPEKPGIKFTERMAGFFSTEEKSDYEIAYLKARQAGSPFNFILTILSPDAEAMIADPQHMAGMAGTVLAPALSPEPLTATEGVFNLFVQDQHDSQLRYMRYQMRLTDTNGRAYFFEGHKTIHDDTGFDLWKDTTTLFITVYNGENATATVLGKGMLHIEPADFKKQLTSVKVLNTSKLSDRLATQAKFLKFFVGNLFEVYF